MRARIKSRANSVSPPSTVTQFPSCLGYWLVQAIFLALDWNGGQEALLIGRHPDCDLVMADATVSRRHARLIFRDGGWIIQDLESTNGTRLNGKYVGRCRLHPGDQLALGDQLLRID